MESGLFGIRVQGVGLMFRPALHPSRCPFFYGWVVLAAGTLGILCSVPGQTMGVSAFTEHLLKALDLSRTQLSVAYMFGTMGSSLILTFAGIAYDRFGASRTAAAACMTMGAVLLALSRVDHIAGGLHARIPGPSRGQWGFGVVLVCFFLLRFSGQGVLTMVSRNMMMKWFDRHRGLVTGISGFFIAPLFSSAPPLLNLLVEREGWRQTWVILGLVAGFGFAVLSLLFYRDHPEKYGLKPDGPLGEPKDGEPRVARAPARSFTLREATSTVTFWVFAVGISLFGLYMTGLSFHVASIFEASGFTAERGFAVFLPGAVIAVVLRPFVGWSADRVELKYLLIYMMAALGLSGVGLYRLGQPEGIWMLIAGNGLAGSAFNTLMTVTWPNFYGREHLGAVSGLSTSITVFSSALGPALFSLIFGRTRAYDLNGLGMATGAGVIILLAMFTRNPQRGAE